MIGKEFMNIQFMKIPFEFLDDNNIRFRVEYHGGTTPVLYRQIDRYWIFQRVVKTNSYNDQPTELEVFYQKSLRNAEH